MFIIAHGRYGMNAKVANRADKNIWINAVFPEVLDVGQRDLCVPASLRSYGIKAGGLGSPCCQDLTRAISQHAC